jgi:hypothetical protein
MGPTEMPGEKVMAGKIGGRLVFQEKHFRNFHADGADVVPIKK